MCYRCSVRDVALKTQSEAWAMEGCFELWQRWCALNSELIEPQVLGWLYNNSQCLRIMGLQTLVQQRTEIEKRVDKRTPQLLKQYRARLAQPYRPKKKPVLPS